MNMNVPTTSEPVCVSQDLEMSEETPNIVVGSNSSVTMSTENTNSLPLPITSLVPFEPGNSILGPEDAEHLRHPSNLQELLALSTRLHTGSGVDDSTSNTENVVLDEERKGFLMEALSHSSAGIVGELEKLITILRDATTKPYTDLANCELALETINYHIYDIDVAGVFYQIGGLDSLIPLLNHKKNTLRWMSASVISDCCQNNPYCKKLSMGDPVFSPLMEIIAKDSDCNAKLKAISAISAIVRDNPDGMKQFRKYDGFNVLSKSFINANEKVAIKLALLVAAVCYTDDAAKGDLLELGLVETLVSLARLTDTFMAEHFLGALYSLVRDHAGAKKECLRKELELKEFLRRTISKQAADEACKELVENAELILGQLEETTKLQ